MPSTERKQTLKLSKEKWEGSVFWAGIRAERAWNEMFLALLAYRDANGHISVSKKEDKRLYNWVCRQRQMYKRKELSEERKNRLEAVDFPFVLQYQKKRKFTAEQNGGWNHRYEELKEFRSTFGNCRVPREFESNRSLGRWVAQQRSDNKQGLIDPERKQKLDVLDFEWFTYRQTK